MAGIQTASSATRLNSTGTVTNTIGIPGFDPEEKAGDEAGEAEGRADADDDADDGEAHALPDDEIANAGAVGAERHADAHFLRALLHGVRHEAVDADGGEDERGGSEDGEQEHVEVLARGGVVDDFGHGADAGDGKAAAGLAQLFGDGGDVLVRVAVGADEPDHGADAGVERGHAVGDLAPGNDHERAGIAVEAAVVDVADDADDLARGPQTAGRRLCR